MRNIFLYVLFTLTLINCKGQKKDEISNFNKVSDYYFDKEEKIPSKFNLNKKNGEYIIYYIPTDSIKEYYDNFLKINNINPVIDEYNDTYDYKENDKKKINSLLKNKLNDVNNYNIIGKHISSKYFQYEGNGNYSIDYPYIIKFYKKDDEKWIFIKEFNVKNYDDNIKYSKKEFLKSLILNTNFSDKKSINSNKQTSYLKDWEGRYSLTLNEDSDDWRNIHEIKLTISKDSVIYTVKGFQLYEYYILSTKETQKFINLHYLKALDNTENIGHLKKTKDFGTFTFDGKNYILESPYIDLNFNNGRKNKYKLIKSNQKN
ncbi:hypothetical protein PGH12_10530 [Chryseobacterium wangxinyae]|uniref:hypothetical protein n=1 Tax=Chryseobacterium sp. CY350 TaxID=2997336 RepID=UPI0022719ADE|nr:hypothetical protein [Chryseobacterium sp. CY350]MCY0978707.1 hypothetical protein [Chryseobacterium sp. CY350]WBZ93912.1 hypothetical protein PGH12_10530 [Chryseobacterium sp. CY350]